MATQNALHGIRWLALTAVVGALGCATSSSATEGEASRAKKDAAEMSEGSRAVWDAAASRGAIFRAVGQEPGWVVEVFEGDTTRLEAKLSYGERSLVVDPVTRDGADFTGTGDDGTMVRLRVLEESCVDPMSGESFPTHATLEVGTEIFRGCGRTLAR